MCIEGIVYTLSIHPSLQHKENHITSTNNCTQCHIEVTEQTSNHSTTSTNIYLYTQYNIL